VVFLLVASQAEALLPTTLSRCQHLTFQLAGSAAIATHLEGLGVAREMAASLAALSGGRVGWAVTAARQPFVLEVRRHLLDLCARLPEYTLPEGLRLAEEVKQEARLLVQSRAEEAEEGEGEEETDAPAAGGRGTDRALRAELPWCLDVMALWYRDRLAAAHGGTIVNPDYAEAIRAAAHAAPQPEASVAALLAAKHQIQRNANLDLALEALAIALLAGGETPGRSPHRGG
jgi:DNA polymerase-3 subunit delta'